MGLICKVDLTPLPKRITVGNLHQSESSHSSFFEQWKVHNICLRAARGIVRVAFLPIAYSNSKGVPAAVGICLKSGKVLFQRRHGMVISVSYSVWRWCVYSERH